MNTLQSKDGARIAYDRQGEGPALILVDGAMVTRNYGSKAELMNLLAPHFTVYSYDRRGRGDSGDTLPYAVEREIEDIEALIDTAGGSANLVGYSSGGALVLRAAEKLGSKVKKIAVYEIAYNDAPEARQAWKEYVKNLTAALAAGDRGEAVAVFMKLVGTPPEHIAGMRQAPMWAGMEAVAPTLAYDTAVMGTDSAVPVERAARVSMPALAMAGGASPPYMRESAQALSKAMPQGQFRVLEGQTHDVKPTAIVPALLEFFAD